ncbi:MAG TPA: oxygen-dependent coproporphyrinogen oxidase [Arachidicoccus sp.]|nr:oxygen-dependent coproporphyrinogen oxidase [Arachidicoccus sp.]
METTEFKIEEVLFKLGNSADGFRERWSAYILSLQRIICEALEKTDGKARFQTEAWARKANDPHHENEGGGGKTNIITGGHIFEKGGVNTSIVYGLVSEKMRQQLGMDGHKWFACGLSLVLHPFNPFVPTTHANWRYFELYDDAGVLLDRWFGGGADLTPYYLFEEDARHFHNTYKMAMQPFGASLYPTYKTWCDNYFNNAHRGFEMRGIGGIFYDHLKPGEATDTHPVGMNLEQLFAFQKASADQFLHSYLPIVQRRAELPFNADQKYWQEIRRGRYVEFNLIHDRGTLFGLKTNGRTESILMSLPPTVRFDYNYQPAKDSPEEQLLAVCKTPRNWA